jgi:hypothetical protein
MRFWSFDDTIHTTTYLCHSRQTSQTTILEGLPNNDESTTKHRHSFDAIVIGIGI